MPHLDAATGRADVDLAGRQAHPSTPTHAGRAWEHEVKFLLPARAVALARNWIASACLPERAYPPAWVVTVYFDTADLALLNAKVNSDYFKTKIRVRWYRTLDGAGPTGPAFVECKSRVGTRRGKLRVPADLPASEVACWPLTDGRWSRMLDVLPLSSRGAAPRLEPVVRLRYRRDRFTDQVGARFSIDSGITVEAVNPAHVRTTPVLGTLPHAVVEYKGGRSDVPAALRPIIRLGARKTSYSKYLACYDHATRSSS